MMQYIGYPPVCELLVMLIALTPVPRTSQLYVVSAKSRWSFFEELSDCNIMLRITKLIVNAEQYCYLDGYISAEQHTSCATQLFLELIEKLSLEDTGEILLQPLGCTTPLLDLLIDTSIHGQNKHESLRRSCTRLVCFILRRAAESEILCFVNHANGVPPTATYVPNRLYPLRERIVNHVRSRICDITNYLLSFDDVATKLASLSLTLEVTKYSSYVVEKPFTALRALVVEMLTLMVESDETVAGLIPINLWIVFISWTMTYAHNNIYHALFYRLVFAVLRFFFILFIFYFSFFEA
jgi:hypothetical protein